MVYPKPVPALSINNLRMRNTSVRSGVNLPVVEVQLGVPDFDVDLTRDCVASTVLSTLGEEPLSLKLVSTHMTLGVFRVDSVETMGRGNYTVSFVK